MNETIRLRIKKSEKQRLMALAQNNNRTLSEIVREHLKHSQPLKIDPDLYKYLIRLSRKAGLPVADLIRAAVFLRS